MDNMDLTERFLRHHFFGQINLVNILMLISRSLGIKNR
jgi:hypothetical protein